MKTRYVTTDKFQLKRLFKRCRLFWSLLLLTPFTGFAQEQAHMAVSDTTGTVISRYIYGQFAEHLGRCVYDGFVRDGKIRQDVVDAMKEIRVPLLRWPGGCYADQYHWRDGIGDPSKRPTTVNTSWGWVPDDNSFGTDEFLKLCGLIGCQPYIAGNMGTGTPEEMENWLEYMNYDGPSSLAKMRAANGHPEPYHVAFFGVGNESWGCGGRMTAEDYAAKYRTYANFCKSYPGSPLTKIVSGADGDDYHWTEVMMSRIPSRQMGAIGVHYYASPETGGSKASATQFGEDQYFSALKSALFMDELIRNHAEIMDRYDPQKRVTLAIDEWGISLQPEPGTNPDFLYQQNSLRDALAAASTLNIFNNHCDRVHMANLAQAVNVLQALVLTKGEQMVKTPTWYVFDLFKIHQDAKWLPLKLETPNYSYNYQSIPAVNASASEDSNGTVHITLVNLDPRQSINITTELPSAKAGRVTGEVLNSAHFNDINTFEQRDKVKTKPFTGAQISNRQLHAMLPPMSVVLLTIKP